MVFTIRKRLPLTFLCTHSIQLERTDLHSRQLRNDCQNRTSDKTKHHHWSVQVKLKVKVFNDNQRWQTLAYAVFASLKLIRLQKPSSYSCPFPPNCYAVSPLLMIPLALCASLFTHDIKMNAIIGMVFCFIVLLILYINHISLSIIVPFWASCIPTRLLYNQWNAMKAGSFHF